LAFSSFGRLARQVVVGTGALAADAPPASGGFGAGLRRIAGQVAPIIQLAAPQISTLIKLGTGDFAPGTPPGRLPQSITPPTPAARLGEQPVTLSFAEQQQLIAVFARLSAESRRREAVQAMRLPPGRLISDQSGGTNLRKFIAPERSNPMAIDIADAIQPTQEMIAFQQETFTIRGSVAGLAGQTVTFTVTVPRDEAWQVDHMTMFILNGDRAVAVTLIRNANSFLISRLVVQGTSTALIYHATAGLAGNAQDYLPPEPLKLYGGDLLETSTAALLANGTVQLEMAYRHIPLPKTNLVSEEAFVIVAA